MVLDTIIDGFRKGAPGDILFADDLMVIAESVEQLQKKWIKWQEGMAKHGLHVQ